MEKRARGIVLEKVEWTEAEREAARLIVHQERHPIRDRWELVAALTRAEQALAIMTADREFRQDLQGDDIPWKEWAEAAERERDELRDDLLRERIHLQQMACATAPMQKELQEARELLGRWCRSNDIDGVIHDESVEWISRNTPEAMGGGE